MTIFNRAPGPRVAGGSVILAGVLGLAMPLAVADEHRVTGEAPGAFVVEDGKVDPATYDGYIAFTRACLACHGPDGMGSTFAPSLIRAAERLSWAEFSGTIAAGRSIQPGQVMPSFADDPYVLANMENIYSYMRARGEGGLGRGRPKIIESMQENEEPEPAESDDAVHDEKADD